MVACRSSANKSVRGQLDAQRWLERPSINFVVEEDEDSFFEMVKLRAR